jgi:uncharacterized membrane protein YhaH (DUF805 family)
MSGNGLVDFLFSFNGRVRRKDFWLFFVLLWLLTPVAFWSFTGFNVRIHTPGFREGLLAAVFGIAATWAHLAVLTKRWHDRAKSGWWTLIGIIPIIGWLWILIECGLSEGTAGGNRYGPSPKPL